MAQRFRVSDAGRRPVCCAGASERGAYPYPQSNGDYGEFEMSANKLHVGKIDAEKRHPQFSPAGAGVCQDIAILFVLKSHDLSCAICRIKPESGRIRPSFYDQIPVLVYQDYRYLA